MGGWGAIENWGHKITDFVFLAFISFIIAFSGFECIWRL